MLYSLSKKIKYIKNNPDIIYEVKSYIKQYGFQEVLKKIIEIITSHSVLENKQIEILFIEGGAGSISSFYRINQVCISLEKAGFKTTKWKEDSEQSGLHAYDLFVLFRCGLTPVVKSIFEHANLQSKCVIYDSDEALFIEDLGAQGFNSNQQKVQRKLDDSRTIIKRVNVFIGATDNIAMEAKPLVKGHDAYVIRNYPPEFLFKKKYKKYNNTFNFYYFSRPGTYQKDFLQISSVLEDILRRYENVRLYIVGMFELEAFPFLIKQKDKKIYTLPNIPIASYYDELEKYMINASAVLLPIDLDGELSDDGSELKFVDAGMFSVPCVVSASNTFKQCIINNNNGIYCHDEGEWKTALENIINDEVFYKKISDNVKEYIDHNYGPSIKDKNVIDTYIDIIDRDPELSRRLRKRNRPTFLPIIRCGNTRKREVDFPQKPFIVEDSQFPVVDISISTFFSSKALDKFFQSLEEDEYPNKKINIYLTDRSGVDEEIVKLKTIVSFYNHVFKSVIIDFNSNIGLGEAYNSNIKKGVAKYILIASCDLELDKKTLSTLVRQALNDKDDVASWEARQLPYENPKFYDPVTLDTAWSSAACIMVRRSAYDHVGGFDKEFFMYFEDIELSFRFREYGYKVKYTPKAVVYRHTYEEKGINFRQVLSSFLERTSIRYRYGKSKGMKWKETGKWYKEGMWQLGNKIDFNSPLVKDLNRRYEKNLKEAIGLSKKSGTKSSFLKITHEVYRNGEFYRVKKVQEKADLVSVIVRVHGDNEIFLNEAIACILNQTYAKNEIVVVEDRTNFCQKYCQAVKETGVNIKYFINSQGGRNSSANVGLKGASGQYIMFLDYDDLLFSDHIETLIDALKSTKNCSAAIGQSWMIYTKYRDGNYFESDYQVFNKSNMKKISYKMLLKTSYFPIQAILFSRKLYDKYGGVNEELPSYEDWELWLRYSQNEQFIVVPKTTSLFRVRDFSFHNVDKKARQQEGKEMIKQMYQVSLQKHACFER